jgi:hypothetical protein
MSTSPSNPLVEVIRARDPALADRALRVILGVAPLLAYTVATFPEFTDHTSAHTNTVECIARMWLPDEFLAALDTDELFFLAVACHFHDLALAGTQADEQSQQSRQQVRDDHEVRVGDKLREKWDELGFEGARSAEILAEVCRGHRPTKNNDGEATWEELQPTEILRPGVNVRVRLLAALIYAVDELHIGADRVSRRAQHWREVQHDEDRRHFRRHEAVHGPARDGMALCFQAEPDTPAFEENLRSRVFRKALLAVRDLRRQATASGVAVPLPEIELRWDRKRMWPAMLYLACADLLPRSPGGS